MDTIYLDNNATTTMFPAVWEAMQPLFTNVVGNPSSPHSTGRRARKALDEAREITAAILDAHPDEVVFTSGATEANNLALFGLVADSPGRLLSSPLEHPSVREPLEQLVRRGYLVEQLPVDSHGVVLLHDLPSDTLLATVQLANHETGAVQPVKKLVEQLGDRTLFHCDAVQAVGRMPVSFRTLGVDTLSLSAHKFHGPRGVGALLVRRGVKLRPLLFGGPQQRGLRPGTEPVALAVGLATALDIWRREGERRTAHVTRLRERFLSGLRQWVPDVVLNGPITDGVPHTINVSFPGCRSETLLMKLDLAGVCCSTGSACSSGSLLPSPVLRAMSVSEELLRSALRFSLCAELTESEIDEAIHRIARAVAVLRASLVEE